MAGRNQNSDDKDRRMEQVPSDISAPKAIINLDQGDPTVYEGYWESLGDRCTVTFTGHQSLSYFANRESLCWFMEPKLEAEIKRLHAVVGNAKVDDHYIVIGTGSSQLLQATLYALSLDSGHPSPASVVAAAPYYSTYVEEADLLKSKLFEWAGDANTFEKDGLYIEMVTSPNNPDGRIREPVVNRPGGKVVYDLAYYWPHYTPITAPLDLDIMIFTFSKCTGHAGSRIGWALVRDIEVARKMVKYIEVSTIGVAKESQLRAAKILGVISDICSEEDKPKPAGLQSLFECGRILMAERWERLRAVLKGNEKGFSLPEYPREYCSFSKEYAEAHPGFAWLRCKDEDLEKILKQHKIVARGGRRFGTEAEYARISMLGRDEEFDLLLQRLSTIKENTCV